MYYGGWGHCNVVKLKDDFSGITAFPDGKSYKEITPEGYVEGPYMMYRNGYYYFMWSEGGWGGPDYKVAYAMSNSPLGPFKRLATVLQQDPHVATGAGHHSVIHSPGTMIIISFTIAARWVKQAPIIAWYVWMSFFLIRTVIFCL